MARLLFPRLWLLFACLPCFAHGADRWAQLKLGMTADETAAVLGTPLVRNVGRGFELWIYDHDAEVLFFGDLVGWTSPGTGALVARTADIWQANRGRDDFRGVLASLPPPRSQRLPARTTLALVREVVWRPSLRFRP